MNEMSRDLDEAVAAQCELRLDLVRSLLADDKVESLDDLRDRVADQPVDETAAIDLDLDDRLAVLQEHADEYGIDLEGVQVSKLSEWIEQQAAVAVSRLGDARAGEVLDDLEDILDRFDVQLDELRSSNAYGMFRHYREKSGGANVQIYEYRNVEGGHVDVYEIRLSGLTLYFETRRDDVTDEEANWDAT